MTSWRSTFDLIESAVERGKKSAKAEAEWIDSVITYAMDSHASRGLGTLNGADPCERVAEALAVWIKESRPQRFAEMTGTRYSVASLDTAAEGMERLRNRDEFILLAYPTADTTAAEIESAWLQDIGSTDRGDGFDYDGAELAVREYVKDKADALEAELAVLAAMERRDAVERGRRYDDSEGFTFRLYVRDLFAEEESGQ